jgi:molecular chaperone DnaJ
MIIDYYTVLGVEQTASQDEIKNAYKKLAIKYHPDKNQGDDDIARRFVEVNEANSTLGDPEKRKKYDAKMSASHDFDFFRNMFGDDQSKSNPSAADFTHSNIKPELPSGADITIPMVLSLSDLYKGKTKIIKLTKNNHCRFCSGTGAKTNKHCSVCNGKGKVRKMVLGENGKEIKVIPCETCYGSCIETDIACTQCEGSGFEREETTIKVRIPKGFNPTKKLKVPGKGEAGKKGGPYGNLYIEITETPDPIFTRDGNDLRREVDVSITDLVLGNKIKIDTWKQTVDMNIPKLTQPGTEFRLPKFGMYVSDDEIGDLYIMLKLIVPEEITEEQELLFQKLRGCEFPSI